MPKIDKLTDEPQMTQVVVSAPERSPRQRWPGGVPACRSRAAMQRLFRPAAAPRALERRLRAEGTGPPRQGAPGGSQQDGALGQLAVPLAIILEWLGSASQV